MGEWWCDAILLFSLYFSSEARFQIYIWPLHSAFFQRLASDTLPQISG